MCALLGRCVAIQMITVMLTFLMAFVVLPPSAKGADFEIPLKELPPAAGTGYEIPLSDLTREERKKPKKPRNKNRAEKKISNHVEQETPQPPSVPSSESALPSSSAHETGQAVAPAAQSPQKPALTGKEEKTNNGTTDKSAAAADKIVIVHEPYSYVVAGKPTVIDAVIISSPGALRSVRCRFRAAETGGYASVAMQKMPGSTYTYTATLPPLSQGSNPLRYSVIATDALHKETRSREFVTPDRATSVVPGWQLETSQGKIKVWLEDPPNPLVGFSDTLVEDTGKP